jgi:hypothetical protein
MGETDFRFVAFFGDFKDDFCALPLAFVFSKIEIVVHNKPSNFLSGIVRNEFY